VLDNLINSSPESVPRVAKLASITGKDRLQLVLMDLRDVAGLHRVFSSCGPFDAVIHFAGLKAVGESVSKPLLYYDNNVAGTVILLRAMANANVTKIIFSSSATVYGTSKPPLKEDATTGQGITNPYGQTKYAIEQILHDCVRGKIGATPWQAISLRYFNPIGAHPSGDIGEHPNGIPNNVMPYVTQVATKIRTHLTVFGTDYATKDGTGERDYIHVSDLAEGHVAALRHFAKLGDKPASEHFNLGTGNATSVLALVAAFKAACSCDVPVVHGKRRVGDLAELYADPTRANVILGWKATRSIATACADTCTLMLLVLISTNCIRHVRRR
jgi:UDP-glucose 4-epimerase